MELMKHQEKAVNELGNGKVLWGGVGTGKSATAIAYYCRHESPKDVYVITTAKKRDSLDWQGDAAGFGLGTDRDGTTHGVLTVDSWNNIEKYVDVTDSFFIFDEQRLVGHGKWVKTFLKIAKKNRWILLSATPGDTWLDYAPVFIANQYYKNITAFKREHVLYEPYVKYPKVRGYLGERRLEALRNEVLVEMPFVKETERILNWMEVDHDQEIVRKLLKERWNIFEDEPIKDAAELFRVMRKVVNSDPSRLAMIRKLMECHPRLIIFYNFNYELEILRELKDEVPLAEWNGHKKQEIPETDRWVYLVQYVSGAEGWNCVATDAMVLYSMTYSYKNFEQAQGRIDRLNTQYRKLYYYILLSNSISDLAVKRSLMEKKSFNERNWINQNLEGIGSFDDFHYKN